MLEVPYGLEYTHNFRIQNIGGGPAFVDILVDSMKDGEIDLKIDNNPIEIRSHEWMDFKVFFHF